MSDIKIECDVTIDHDLPNCIGCGACAAIEPEVWEMKSMEDGQFKAVNNKTKITKEEYPKQKECADCCPVNVIHLVREDTKEKII